MGLLVKRLGTTGVDDKSHFTILLFTCSNVIYTEERGEETLKTDI